MKPVKMCFLLLIIIPICSGQDKAVLLDSLFNTMHLRSQFNGNILIAEKGKIIYTKCYGFADRENHVPLNPNSLFNVGSVSKAFTGVAIQQLEEKNKLKISDKVIDYLPGFPYPDITIHHLLIHAGGLPADYGLLKNWDNSKIATNDDVLSALYTQKPDLIFTPGARSEYNNLGYIILSEIVEKVTNMKFRDYLDKNIFKPANMIRTNIYNAEEINEINNVARGYLFYPFTGKYEEAIRVHEFSSSYAVSGFQGDGNIYSTITDLNNFIQALPR